MSESISADQSVGYRGLVIQESLTNASASCKAFQQPAGGCWFSISPIIVLAAVKNGVKYQSNPWINIAGLNKYQMKAQYDEAYIVAKNRQSRRDHVTLCGLVIMENWWSIIA